MRCKTCHYDLSNLAPTESGGQRCPECGRDFDPHDPATYERYERLQQQEAEQASRLPLRDVAIVVAISYVIPLIGFLWDSRLHSELDLRTRLTNTMYDALRFWPFGFAIIFVLYLLVWRAPQAIVRAHRRSTDRSE